MPDPFDVDEARRALDAVPAPDQWHEATRRAAAASVTTLDPGDSGRRRPGRWLAVAAVAVLAVGTTAVLLDDDGHSDVDTAPSTSTPPAAGTRVVGDVCTIGIGGDPIVVDPGPADPPLFALSGQPEGQLVAHTRLGASQVAELHVPGLVLDDLVGERVEEVELERGTASVWFGPDFVQVRWFPGAQEPCESFTVTVTGSTEDGNRHAAVDLAERILLPSDLAGTTDALLASLEGEWRLESAEVDGEPTDGRGLLLTFADGQASWNDGCNGFGGRYEALDERTLRLQGLGSTLVGCPYDPTARAIQEVMGAERIEVSFGAAAGSVGLRLSAGDTVLALLRINEPGVTPGGDDAASLVGSSWVVEGIRVGAGDVVPIAEPRGANAPDVEFGPDTISFDDTCNGQLASDVAYEGSVITIGRFGGTERGCGDPIAEQAGHIQQVMQGPVEVAFVEDRLELSGHGRTLVLRPT